jgi:tetratricopeptide (TPR) repeat protein
MLGDFELAVVDAEQAIEIDSHNFHAYFQLAEALGALMQWDKAVEARSQVILLRPDDSHAWNWRSVAYRNAGQLNRAVEDATKAIELDRRNVWPFVERACARILLGKYEKAIADCDEALRLDANSYLGYERRAWARNMLGDFEGAVVDAKRAVELDSQNAFAYRQLANAHKGLKQWDKALANYREAIRLAPKDPGLYNELARAMIATQQWDEAGRCFEQLVELQPKNIGYLKQLAWCEYMSRGVDASRQRCRTAIERFITPEASAPVKREVVEMCCSVMNAVDDTEAMVELAREVIAANPPNEAWSRGVFVQALLCNGQSGEAISRLLGHEADATNKIRGYTMFLLAKAYHASGKPDVAIEWLNKADTWTSQYLARGDYEFPVFPLILQVGQKDAHEFLGIPASQDSTSVESKEVAASGN